MSLKRLKPNAITKICSSQDSAIDEEATGDENLTKFNETHDMDLLKFKDGAHPTVFHVSNITPEDEAEIQEDHYVVEMPDLENMSAEEKKKAKPKVKQVKQQQMFMKYFKAGVAKIEDDGKIEETVNCSEWPLSIQQEIGGFIMLRSALGDTEKKS